MRSFFPSAEAARNALRQVLPGQENPWVLFAPLLPCGASYAESWVPPRDSLGYLRVVEPSAGQTYEDDDIVLPAIFADLSGRHADKPELIIATLQELQRLIGGRITNDGWGTQSPP